MLGVLTGWALQEVGFGVFLGGAAGLFAPVTGVLGAMAARTRARRLLWTVSAAAAILFLGISYSPLSGWLMGPLLVDGKPESAPAVVVLASDIYRNGDLNAAAQSRFLRAYELLRQGYAKELVVTRLPPVSRSYVPTVKRQLNALGLDYQVTEVGRVNNTHDEATRVAALARTRHWYKVLLVTQPWHMRRAVAVFEKAGLHAIPAPCVEGSYELTYLHQPGDRRWAFRDWLHEIVGIQIYRLRGWI